MVQLWEARLELGHRGKRRVIADYALHLQCPWRICGPAGIVVGSQDLFYPAGDPSVEPPDFDWDVPGSTRRDERMSEFLASRETAPLYVLAVSADEAGSISLDFVGGYSMDVFPVESLEREYWRLFQPGKDGPHFVVTGRGIED